jgi:hypothetical protein
VGLLDAEIHGLGIKATNVRMGPYVARISGKQSLVAGSD